MTTSRPGRSDRCRFRFRCSTAAGATQAYEGYRASLTATEARFNGGLITSTVLSLLVVPAVFTYVDDIGQWSHRMAGRLRGSGKRPPSVESTRDPAGPTPPAEA